MEITDIITESFIVNMRRLAFGAAIKKVKVESTATEIAEEAVSNLLYRWTKNWDKMQNREYDWSDDFVFISLKFQVINELKKAKSKSHSQFLDYDNISLDIPYQGLTLEFEDNADQIKEEKLEYEESIQQGLNEISKVLSSSNNISDTDVQIFIQKYVDDKTYKEICAVLNISEATIAKSLTKSRRVLKYEIKGECF